MEYYDSSQMFKKALERLNERQKELSCLYHILEELNDAAPGLELLFRAILKKIPSGWQYPSVCEARIIYEGTVYPSPGFRDTPWMQSASLVIDNHVAGSIQVAYTQLIREVNGSQFLPEEQQLLNTIAERLSAHLFFRRLRNTLNMLESQTGKSQDESGHLLGMDTDDHWKWRMHMAELIASRLDPERFGVKSLYIIGSTKNAIAGPGSDIDLIVHLKENLPIPCELRAWLEGWSMCLAEMNYHRTGHFSDGLLDVHYVTDQDIADKTSYAVMIERHTDQARALPLRQRDTDKKP